MATLEECESALRRLGALLGSVDADAKRKHALDRSLSCRIRDLDTTFRGELRDGELHDIRVGDADGAQVKMQVSSDDLVALTEGRLSFPVAWATGKLRIDASISDMLKLRSLL
ncbi:MAG TPA: SCP2 sterol-binding domain-containing protein [Mycobacteriales bacterium]|nr:SCP2 sterol-binding domain-containing protein [Mycobacteriales bacterium]